MGVYSYYIHIVMSCVELHESLYLYIPSLYVYSKPGRQIHLAPPWIQPGSGRLVMALRRLHMSNEYLKSKNKIYIIIMGSFGICSSGPSSPTTIS